MSNGRDLHHDEIPVHTPQLNQLSAFPQYYLWFALVFAAWTASRVDDGKRIDGKFNRR